MKLHLAPIVILIAAIALGESAYAKKAMTMKLIEQKPIFDTSVLPKRTHFELKIKQTQILNTQDPGVMLRAKTAILTGSAGTQILKGGVTQAEVRTPIFTRERSVRGEGLFRLDLSTLIPKIAPDIALHLQAKVDQANKRLAAQVAEQKPLMDRQLAARIPQVTIPVVPRLPANVDLAKQIPVARIPSIPVIPQQVSTPSGGPDLQAAVDRVRARALSMPGAPQNGAAMPGGGGQIVGKMPGAPQIGATMPVGGGQLGGDLFAPKNSAATDIALRRANEAMRAQLLASKKVPVTDVNAKLLDAKKQMDQFAKEVEPQLAAISTQVRRLPANTIDPLSAIANLGEEKVGNKVIAWDPWHARFAKVAGASILKKVNAAGGPVGMNTVVITVRPDHRITVTLDKAGNAAFDKAILQAYKGLEGSDALSFPGGSMRKSITFLVDNKHESKGNASVVNSVTSVGDKEVHHF